MDANAVNLAILALMLFTGACSLVFGLGILLLGAVVRTAAKRDPQFKEPRHVC